MNTRRQVATRVLYFLLASQRSQQAAPPLLRAEKFFRLEECGSVSWRQTHSPLANLRFPLQAVIRTCDLRQAAWLWCASQVDDECVGKWQRSHTWRQFSHVIYRSSKKWHWHYAANQVSFSSW